MPEMVLLHATCVAMNRDGVLILGPPGSGKSDLALRLIDQPGAGTSGRRRRAQLVADDQVLIHHHKDGLTANAPSKLVGKLEIRGLGIVMLPVRASVSLTLAVQLTEAAKIDRLPETDRARFEVLGVALPLVLIDPAYASAPARIRAALDWHKPAD
jgi:serine kinase of HPr protein (carbohydrate metabolism regulator)